MNINRLLKAVTHPTLFAEYLIQNSHLFDGMSDERYIRLLWWLKYHERLNLDNPQTYNEKLQWLKLHDRKPLYTTIVDKLTVKDYVSSIIGSEYIIPTIKVFPGEVKKEDFLDLPEKFVLKTNQGSSSAGVIVCRSKGTLDIEKAAARMNQSLKSNVYKAMREWPYKDIVPKVFAEKYMEDESGELIDYKFFCFSGKVKALFIGTERFSDEVKFDFFDADFNHLDLYQVHPMSKKVIKKPINFEEMKSIAERLAAGFSHVRVDLYNISGKIYFGEITFYHHGGFAPFHPEKWNRIFGEWIDLSLISSK